MFAEISSDLNIPSLHRIYATVRRLRQSLGFGVHSPYIYGLQTDVFRERRPYYAYEAIERLSDDREARVNKLLFRLANHFRPENVVGVGPDGDRGLECMSLACRGMRCHMLLPPDGPVSTGLLRQALGEGGEIGFLYIAHPRVCAEAYEAALPLAGDRSLFIIKGIHACKELSAWWKSVEHDAARTGITFDLYDVGLVFFDRKRPRRNYKMMF